MKTFVETESIHRRFPGLLAAVMLGIGALTMITGCKSEPPVFEPVASAAPSAHPSRMPSFTPPVATNTTTNSITSAPNAYILRAGDTLKISFPGSPNLNSIQQIRTDGKINLQLVGEISAAGLTPDELQKKLMELYAPQLTSKQVIVEVQSSSFPVYVSGAVLRPGKVTSDRPITALEAIMEAGGFDYTKADLKDVEVIRQEGNQTRHYRLDLKRIMDGKSETSFYMKPSDIIYVPEKFSWF